MISSKIKDAIRNALSAGDEFAVYRMPGRTAKFITANSRKDVDFRITPWNTPWNKSIQLSPVHSEPTFTLPAPTSQSNYLQTVGQLIEELKERGRAKTVISRTICGANPEIDWADAAEALWDQFPDTFGFLFYTATTGGWLGASPEKLLTTTPPSLFSTHALAGTSSLGADWDRKNYDEHMMVVEFIRSVLSRHISEFNEMGPKSLQYGNLQHLSTVFSGTLSDSDKADTLRDELSPTPALAGYPRAAALADIETLERHKRQCYGGYITVSRDGASASYVTLRCAQFDPRDGRWAIYAGGGITPKSNPADEWAETEAKAHTLLSILCNARYACLS